MFPGRGVTGNVDGKEIIAGNMEMLADNGITVTQNAEILDLLHQGSTVIYVVINGIFSGYISLADTIRSESESLINKLSALNTPVVLLTGDNKRTAYSIADKLHINEVKAGCLPENKLEYIDSTQKKNEDICMIGDGINDAPALKEATVGIAMGGVGSDIAVDAADIVLVDDEIKELPHLVSLSKQMMKIIKRNLTFSMLLNVVAVTFAMTGILNPVMGALVHTAGSTLVIINSALLLKWKSKEYIQNEKFA